VPQSVVFIPRNSVYASPSGYVFLAWFCHRSLPGIAVSNPEEAWMSVSCECLAWSGRGLFDGPIPRPEESYSVCVCERERERESN